MFKLGSFECRMSLELQPSLTFMVLIISLAVAFIIKGVTYSVCVADLVLLGLFDAPRVRCCVCL